MVSAYDVICGYWGEKPGGIDEVGGGGEMTSSVVVPGRASTGVVSGEVEFIHAVRQMQEMITTKQANHYAIFKLPSQYLMCFTV